MAFVVGSEEEADSSIWSWSAAASEAPSVGGRGERSEVCMAAQTALDWHGEIDMLPLFLSGGGEACVFPRAKTFDGSYVFNPNR